MPNETNVYKTRPNEAINPENLYITTIKIITQIIPITPAVKVLSSESAPNEASTVLDDISFNFVGKAPELISSTKEVTSSFVKLP